jgi:hypothetical protein
VDIACAVRGLATALGEPGYGRALDYDACRLTDTRFPVGDGRPVLICIEPTSGRERVLWPHDLKRLLGDRAIVAVGRSQVTRRDVLRARAAGWTIEVKAYCECCRRELPEPECWEANVHAGCAERFARYQQLGTPV